MKLYVLLLAFPVLVCGQTGKVTVRVTDYETGMVITNARVVAGFNTNIKPGWGWGGGKPNDKAGYTGTDGMCTLSGKGNGASVGIAAFKEGYYGNSGYSIKFTNTTGLIFRRWQPWNPTVDVVMKRIVDPVPLYARPVRRGRIPKEEEPLGFDLFVGDWIMPYGTGKQSDFLIMLTRKPELIVERNGVHGTYDITLYDITLLIQGAHDGDGFIEIPIPVRQGGSSLRMPREAPPDGYEPVVTKRNFRDSIDKPTQHNIDETMNYFFRVRTVLDKDGKVESALYGKIHGDFQLDHNGEFGFCYYLNPTPNDQNLEFDRERNLFKNLSSEEQVQRP